jgi:hypothetical protein
MSCLNTHSNRGVLYVSNLHQKSYGVSPLQLITVNPSVVYIKYSNTRRRAEIYLLAELLGTPKRMGYLSCKDDPMAYALCILILFAFPLPPSILSGYLLQEEFI